MTDQKKVNLFRELGDTTTEITVTCVRREVGGHVTTVLLYDGQEGADLKIPVNTNCSQIRFNRGADSPVNFQLTGANIVPTYKDGVVYGDLQVGSIDGSAVIIDDKHLHGTPESGPVTVGNVYLFYFVIPEAGGEAGSFASDPEIINTGRYN